MLISNNFLVEKGHVDVEIKYFLPSKTYHYWFFPQYFLASKQKYFAKYVYARYLHTQWYAGSICCSYIHIEERLRVSTQLLYQPPNFLNVKNFHCKFVSIICQKLYTHVFSIVFRLALWSLPRPRVGGLSLRPDPSLLGTTCWAVPPRFGV